MCIDGTMWPVGLVSTTIEERKEKKMIRTEAKLKKDIMTILTSILTIKSVLLKAAVVCGHNDLSSSEYKNNMNRKEIRYCFDQSNSYKALSY